MDDELLKRNTDCVYFLASPFTCKKGAECEYRHSEMARLNPRDCWYWLSGKCLNPTCGFRHPPMDTHTEASAQGEHFPNNSGLPPIKNNVPCYYFFQGRCDKGDKCTFLHGSEDTSAVKPKIESAPTALPSLDTKIPSKVSVTKLTAEQLDSKLQPLTMVDTKIRNRMTDSKLCLLTEPVPDPLEKSLGLLEVPLKTADKLSMHQEKQIHSSDTCIILEGKTLRQELASEFEEAHANKSASLNPPENIVRSDLSIYSDQSSDDRVDKDVVRDELWESSPGFDVLVEGRSEGMTYGDEHEYMHGYNDEHNENHLLDHHYEDQNGSSESLLHENRMRDPCYYSDDDERYDTNGYSHVVRGDNRIMPQKRKLGLPFGGHYSGDLREHLSKRRFHESRDSFRRCSFPLYTEERHEEPIQRLHGRLASKLERNGISLMKEKEPVFVVPNQRDEVRNSELTARHHHHHHERKRLQFSSRVQKKPFSRPNRESDSNISFTGPKTLAQIKEEKDKAREGLSLSSEARHSSQNGLVGFEGPKPLTEILKEKKTSTSALDLI